MIVRLSYIFKEIENASLFAKKVNDIHRYKKVENSYTTEL